MGLLLPTAPPINSNINEYRNLQVSVNRLQTEAGTLIKFATLCKLYPRGAASVQKFTNTLTVFELLFRIN